MKNEIIAKNMFNAEQYMSECDYEIQVLKETIANDDKEIKFLKDKLSRRNMQIKELKKKKIEATLLEKLLHEWQATETMSFDCNVGRRDLALYLTEILNR